MGNSKIKTLSDRMKDYEVVSDYRLTKRTPVIVRIDGKAFHTYTKGLDKPFDNILSEAMNYVCRKLVETVQGCKFAYTQSDEISLLLKDWDKSTTDCYFDYRVQKMVSVLASAATMYFNQYIVSRVLYWQKGKSELSEKLFDKWAVKAGCAMFDARAYNLPKEEVCNYFIWRQEDASRNSIQSLGRSKFSFKQMLNKKNNEVQDMLFNEYDINWNFIDTKWKRGFAVYRDEDGIKSDFEIPLFKQNRAFIDKYLII